MVEIEIKFPKSPKTPPRRRIQNIGGKYSYTEDDYFSIIKIREINNNLLTILEGICRWKDNECYIDGELIGTGYFLNLVGCVLRKEKPNSLKWYYDGYEFHSLIRSYKTFEDLKIALDEENKPGGTSIYADERDFDISWSLRHLVDFGMIKIVIPKKEWKIEIDSILEDIKTKSDIIRKVCPDFDTTKVFGIIRSFPEKIIKNVESSMDCDESSLLNLNPEEVSNKIIQFIKEEFPEETEDYAIRYDILPLFWKRYGISFSRLDNESCFKMKKGEVIARRKFSEMLCPQQPFSREDFSQELLDEQDYRTKVIDLLTKIEENTRK